MGKGWGRERWCGEAHGDGLCVEGTVLGKAVQRGFGVLLQKGRGTGHDPRAPC